MTDYNKIITTLNSVTNEYTFSPDPNKVIVIDTSNNRIGINTNNPNYSLDISNGDINVTRGFINDLSVSRGFINDLSVVDLSVSGNITFDGSLNTDGSYGYTGDISLDGSTSITVRNGLIIAYNTYT